MVRDRKRNIIPPQKMNHRETAISILALLIWVVLLVVVF